MAAPLEHLFPPQTEGPLKGTILVTGGPIVAVGILPSGRAVSLAWNGNAEVWNVETGERVRAAHESGGKVLMGGPMFHEMVLAGTQIVIGGHRGLVVCDEEGLLQFTEEDTIYALVRIGEGSVFVCRKLPSGSTVAARYDTRTGSSTVSEVEAHRAKKILSDSSGRLAVAISYDGAMQGWNVESMAAIWSRPKLRRVRNHLQQRASKVLQFPAIAAGDQFVVSTGTRILCRDFASGDDVGLWRSKKQAEGLAYCAERQQLFASFPDSTVRSFDLRSGAEDIVATGVPTGMLALSPDGTLLLSGSLELAVLDVRSGQRVSTLRGHSLGVNGVAFATDGHHVITGSQDETLRLWNLRAPEAPEVPRHRGGVIHIVIAPDGKHAITAAADDKIGIWDVGGPAKASLFDSGTRLAVAVSADSRALVVGAEGAIDVCAMPSGERVRRIPVKGFVTRLALLGSSGLIAAAVNDGTLLLLEGWSGRLVWRRKAYSDFYNGLRVCRDDRRILTWGDSDEREVKVHDRITGEELQVFDGFTDTVEDAWFFDNGSKVLAIVGGWWDEFDTRLHILDVETGEQTSVEDEMTQGSVEFTTLAVTVDERYAVVGCTATESTASNPLRLWNLRTLQRERYLPSFGSVRSIATIGNTHAVAACTDHCVRVWHLATGDLVAQHRGTSEMWSCAAGGDVVIAGEQSGTVHVLRLHV